MAAVSEAVTVLDVVASPSTPVAHLSIVLTPCMDGSIAHSDLSPAASLAFEIGGCMHLAVNMTTNASYGVSSGEAVQTLVHGQAFSLEGLLQSSDAVGDLAGLGVVCAEILDFALKCGVVLGL